MIRLVFILALLHFACMVSQDRGRNSASTSVTTGNPTGIKLIFQKDSLPTPIFGTVDVFATTQIPVPSYQPLPLLRIHVSGATELFLDSADFITIPDSTWPKALVGNDSTLHFNIVVTCDKGGAIIRDFRYQKFDGSTLASKLRDPIYENESLLEFVDLVPLVEIKCHIDTQTINPYKTHYLFQRGTGFFAVGKNGFFYFPSLPMGSYNLSKISFPDGAHGPGSSNDYLFILGYAPPASPGILNELSFVGVTDSVSLSDSLKAMLKP
ncbi:MAG TPA: hypothetical protein VJ385_02440 [Fibrobacteria bacterium]|nr:hypothetical protein [Fibrobacteria bacterium]